MEEEQHFEGAQQGKVKRFIKESIRVIRITRKPNKTEYVGLVKVTGLGIAVIGGIGFVIFLIKQFIFN
ncbi:protein translocase SEC61 complex subunit gamma [Candidatus Woesearchaeota archaeon]|nr:protein translocase SEC61 complex subunit gamma [Candidatus Woesearchaeota archaeon]